MCESYSGLSYTEILHIFHVGRIMRSVPCQVDNEEQEEQKVCHDNQVQLKTMTSVNMMGMWVVQL
jgi:hypothetical protein